MKGLVLSGGKGTRLRPLTHTRAKQLVPIANKAIVEYVLEDLVRAGITDIGVVISPETGQEIKTHLGDGRRFGASIAYILQDRPDGLAHAVKTARLYLGDSPFVLYLGDNILQGGISHLIQAHRDKTTDACILFTKVPNPESFGVVVRDDAGHIVRLEEKPKSLISDLALVGVYLFTPSIHEVIAQLKPSARGELEITEAIQTLVEQGARVHAEEVRGYWKDTGKPEDLLDANRLVLSHLERNIQGLVENSEIVGEVVIEAGATVRNSRIAGPVVLAAGVRIENSVVGPNVSVGAASVVQDVKISNSIVMREVCIQGTGCTLEASILGEQVRIIPSDNETLCVVLGDGCSVRV